MPKRGPTAGTAAGGADRTPERGRKAGASPAKPWRRERPGSYVSADDRFRVDQEGPGRWFVVDEQQRDELGLPRTTGPFATLEDAREEASRLRSMPTTVSPLLPRIAQAREQQRGQPKAASPRATGGGRPKVEPAAPPPAPPPPPSWLDRLPSDEATRARRLVAGLRRLGLEEAEAIVRADLTGDEPAVARALVARRLRLAAVDPWKRSNAFRGAPASIRRAVEHASAAGLADDELAAIVAFVARTTVAATLEQLTAIERDPETASPLPGWRYIEHDPGRPERMRRMVVTADDVERPTLDDEDEPDATR